MGRKCFVPYCKSGYNTCSEAVTMFSCPSDVGSLEKWSQAIARQDRPLRVTDCICEKHFRDEDVVKSWRAFDQTGKEIMNVAYKRKRLRDGAVPCFFPEGVGMYSRKKRKPRTNHDVQSKKESASKEIEYSGYPLLELSYPVSKEQIKSESEENDAEILRRKVLFNEIWSNSEAVELPSRSWAAYLMNKNERRILLFTQMAFLSNGVPVPAKQVCFDSEMNVELYLKNTKLNFEEMNIMPPKMFFHEDVSSFIKSVDGLIEWE